MLEQAAEWTGGRATGDARITSVVKDTKEVHEGCLFAAIKGERFDGHDFIGEAAQRGAAAVMTARQDESYDIPALYVEDTRQAMLDLAGGYRAQFDCPVVAVTGSVGKTTTRGMTASVLSQLYVTHETQGNLNNQLGLPLTLLGLTHAHEAAVLEMGMSAFGEIASMVQCAKPNLAVITNIGTAHIEHLGSRAGILRAKMEILEGLTARGGIAVLNGDEPLLWEKREDIYGRTIWFGAENEACDVRASGIIAAADSVSFTVHLPETPPFAVHLMMPGTHNVTNALAAAAAGWLLGAGAEEIAAGLHAYTPGEHRQRLYEKSGFMIYEDCYNASPDAMTAALRVLGDLGGRRFAVLGSMLELGDYAAEGHQLTGRAAAQYADVLYAYGEHAAAMAAGAAESGMNTENIRIFDSHEALVQALHEHVQPGDALLFKGSRAMRMERALGLFLGEDT